MRIRKGQTCFSVCYDACGVCLIREREGKKAEGCDRLEERAVIGLTSRSVAVDTFGVPLLMKAHFLTKNK